jgi:hypothetical protein
LHHESVCANFTQRRLMNFERTRAEADQYHLLHRLIPFQKLFRLAHGNPRRTIHRKTIRAGADGWERHGLDTVLFDQRKTTPITTHQQIILAMLAVLPDRADGVNDLPGRKLVTSRDFGLTRPATAEREAFRQQFRTSRPMNGAIHAATAKQRRFGSIHDRLHAPLRDVADDDGDAINRHVN